MANTLSMAETAFNPEAKRLAKEMEICRRCQVAPLLTGEPGVGKSYFVAVYAEMMRKLVLGKTFFQANITKFTDPRVQLGKMLVHGNGSITMSWQDGDLTLAIKAGGLFLADELNRGSGELQNRYFSLLETGYRYLSLFEKGNEVVDVPKDFMLVATQNPPNAKFYNAPLDRALSERFVHYNIDSPLADEGKLSETLLPKAKHGDLAERLFNVVTDSRKTDRGIGMSTRSLAQIGRLIANGFKPIQAFNVAWANRFDEPQDREAAQAVVASHFTDVLESSSWQEQSLF